MELHNMNPFAEIALIILLTLIFMIVGKLLNNIKFKGRTIKIPVVISVVMAGFLSGLIIRSIDPEFSFIIVPYFSTISIILLFIAFGAMIDFKAFKKYGAWTILLGTIPYFIEWLVLMVVITFLTPLLWMEAGLVACLIAMCAPGVVSPKMMDNISKGYEKESNYNETVSLAGAVENIFGLVIMIVLVVFYQSNYSESGGFGIGVTLALPILLLVIGLVLGFVLAMFSLKILKPISNMIIPTYVCDTSKLKGKDLKIANNLNKKSEAKSNNLVWLFVALLFAAVYITLQLTLSIGFIVLEAGLVAGLVISISGSKSLSAKNTQSTIARNSNIFYGLLGCFVVWGFGGMLIDPTTIVGNDWMTFNGNKNFMPNIVSALIFICIAIVFRIIGIFTIMSFNTKYTFKQKLYTIPVMLSTGTAGVNNGVTIFLMLAITDSVVGDQRTNVELLQNMMIVIGAIMTFILIPIGVIILGFGQNTLIFQWKGESEGSYKVKVSHAMSIEKTVNKAVVKWTIKEYWSSFYKEKKTSSSYEKSMNKKLKSLNLDLNYANSILKTRELHYFANNHKLEEYINSEKMNLKYKKISSNNINKIVKKSNSKIEIHKDKNEKHNKKVYEKWIKIKMDISDIENLISVEENYILNKEIPDNVLKARKILKEKSINLKKIISSSIQDANIKKITKELFA